MTRSSIRTLVLCAILAGCPVAMAQTPGTLDPKPLPPVDFNDPMTPAKDMFGRKAEPIPLQARSLGYYTAGCLAGAKALPINGKTWQVMRLSRNRNWGHPNLIRFLERFANQAPKVGWPGLLVGDLSQPRGGPMLYGHWSHQVGLDADIWFTPMPNRELTREERETMMSTSIITGDENDVNKAIWSPAHIGVLRLAAQAPEVERVLVNPAIKRALCRDVRGDRSWLRKVRPVRGHHYHFHIRISCPPGQSGCKRQSPPPRSEGCDETLDWWFTAAQRNRKFKPQPPMRMSALPDACRQVIMHP